jgi:hypothetical protein
MVMVNAVAAAASKDEKQVTEAGGHEMLAPFSQSPPPPQEQPPPPRQGGPHLPPPSSSTCGQFLRPWPRPLLLPRRRRRVLNLPYPPALTHTIRTRPKPSTRTLAKTRKTMMTTPGTTPRTWRSSGKGKAVPAVVGVEGGTKKASKRKGLCTRGKARVTSWNFWKMPSTALSLRRGDHPRRRRGR